MINISINENFSTHVDEQKLTQAATSVLGFQKLKDDVELTIVIEDAETVHELNRTYRGIDSSTDVLSFTADVVDPDTNLRYLGDIIIAYPVAEKQAIEANVETIAEIQLLVVYGVLHLLGYDHDTDKTKSEMWQIQDGILNHIGIYIDRLPE